MEEREPTWEEAIVGVQDENGVDLLLIEENLKLSPAERIERSLAFAQICWDLRKAVETAQSKASSLRA